MSTVRRFDAAQLGQTRRTPQGFLRAPARLTRTGVLVYRRADGTERRELRRPEQVFAAESLATLGDAPLTDLHPKVMVSPDNARELSVGHVSQATVRADGRFVQAEVVVTDAKMIAAVEAGSRREVSCGYQCKLLEGGGVWNGERYDAEQVDIVYNHAGLGPPRWGRAGSEVCVRLDGADDGFALDAEDALRVEADDAPGEEDLKGPATMELVTLRVDGIDCLVPKEWSQVLSKSLEQRDTVIAQAQKEAVADKARLDALQGELDGTKARLEEAVDPKRFDAAVAERIALLERARKVLGSETKLDGKTGREVKELVIKHLDANASFEGRSDEYVQGRFDSLDLNGSSGNVDEARRVTKARADGDVTPIKYPTPPWLKPLAVNRS